MINWRQLARTISRLENNDPETIGETANLPLDSSNVHIIGVTGPPGSGKSTLCGQIIEHLGENHKVAALLVDPSSPYSGGSILGDRIRMPSLVDNPNVYIRSLSNRGNTGGVSRWLVSILKLLVDNGFQYIIIETIGAGQSEVKIASIADTTMVVAVPNLGDDIQAFKSGILEIADILVLNKADLPGVDNLYSALMESAQQDREGWLTRINQTVATQGQGIDELVTVLKEHKQWLLSQDKLLDKRKQATKFELMEISSYMLQKHLENLPAEVMATFGGQVDIIQRLDLAYASIIKSLEEENGV